jgi:small conductance mechanosensitive channel
VNTAFEIRRWEYEFSANAEDGLAQLKAAILETLKNVEGVLSTPPPEALVVDLGDSGLNVVKLLITWWTKSPRQHEMVASHDRVLTAVREAMLRRSKSQSKKAEPRAA